LFLQVSLSEDSVCGILNNDFTHTQLGWLCAKLGKNSIFGQKEQLQQHVLDYNSTEGKFETKFYFSSENNPINKTTKNICQVFSYLNLLDYVWVMNIL